MALEKQKTYKKVFDLACEELRNSGLDERLRKASVAYTYTMEGGQSTAECPFFEETIILEIPRFAFRSAQGSNVTLATKILILHYLLKASGEPLGREKIPYEDIPGCRPYLPVFERRVVRPLMSAFGFDRDLFRSAGEALGAAPESFGDASFTLRALPMVPLTFILWEGDQEFTPSLRILFDPSIDTYLPLEDITVLSKLAAVRILKAAKKSYEE
jgi:hypothetical protein